MRGGVSPAKGSSRSPAISAYTTSGNSTTAGRANPPSTIQRVGDTLEPQPGRLITSRNKPITSANSTQAPASITHHSVAMDPAAGPDGDSVDSDPLQPPAIITSATSPTWASVREALRCGGEPHLFHPEGKPPWPGNARPSLRRRAKSCWN